MFRDHNNNLANFYPNYTSTVNGQTVNGAVILPNQSTFALVNPGFVETLSPTPILTASQVGVPDSLRFSQKRISPLELVLHIVSAVMTRR